MATNRQRRLLIQGWRFIHHSYAIVAQAYGHMLVPSRWVGQTYLRHGIAPERVHVVALGFA